ncbi:peptide chain release factor H [Brumimicrobium mesophilum]|uniref:peptide chain release factor H n=1 Tax=Brumimicrobium mesophilum TaxID=392717 RepID=UPI000D13F4AF|nr:peptide chain release factor H [Brumimicrobium mesophilum]
MKKYIQITSGRGPEECCFVVAQVLKKIIKECKASNCYYEIISREKSNINGNLHSASLWIDTTRNKEIGKDWLGTIQWVGESPFRKYHKRKNWFVGVFEIEQSNFKELSQKEISYEAIRSSGPGGQNVNKVSSAVRATHLPTGISVKVMDTRSQLQNKKLAKQRIEKAWEEHQLATIRKREDDAWFNHMNLERGNPVKVFKSIDFKQEAQPKKFRNERKTRKQEWKREIG